MLPAFVVQTIPVTHIDPVNDAISLLMSYIIVMLVCVCVLQRNQALLQLGVAFRLNAIVAENMLCKFV
jgi:hypothetical protein